jgi:hypothetical protein
MWPATCKRTAAGDSMTRLYGPLVIAGLLGAVSGCSHSANSSADQTTGKADNKSPMPGYEAHLEAVKACGLDETCLITADDAVTGVIDGLVAQAKLPADQQPAAAADAFKAYRTAVKGTRDDLSICNLLNAGTADAPVACTRTVETDLAGFIDRYVNFGPAPDSASQKPEPDALIEKFSKRHPSCYETFDYAQQETWPEVARAYNELASCVTTDTAVRPLPPAANHDLLKGQIAIAIDATNKLCQTLVDAGPTVGDEIQTSVDRAICLAEGANLIDLLFN